MSDKQETIEQLLSAAYGASDRVPEDVRKLYAGSPNYLKGKTAQRGIESRADGIAASLIASRERTFELARLLDQRTREYEALKSKLSQVQVQASPSAVGMMLVEVTGFERILADLRRAVADEETRRAALDSQNAVWRLMVDLARMVNGELLATDHLHLLPTWVVTRDAKHRKPAYA